MGKTDPMSVSVFGVRGAFPALDDEVREFGGNTSCIALDCGSDLVVLDAGSGIVQLGASLEDPSRFQRIHILLSHLHLDHIQGLMGFSPLFDARADIRIYGEQHGTASLEECLTNLLGPPYWPVSLSDVPAQPAVLEIGPAMTFKVSDGVTVKTLRGCHPNRSVLYRIEYANSSVVYTLDSELTPGIFPRLADFARDCDLLIWDSNYMEDRHAKRGWGHSTWRQGLSVGEAAGAKKVMMTHYDRSYTDEILCVHEQEAKQTDENCLFAREGMVIAL